MYLNLMMSSLGGWLIGRLVAPGNSEGLIEGLIEGLVFVAGTSMLSSVTAGSLLIDCVHWMSISHREVVVIPYC